MSLSPEGAKSICSLRSEGTEFNSGVADSRIVGTVSPQFICIKPPAYIHQTIADTALAENSGQGITP